MLEWFEIVALLVSGVLGGGGAAEGYRRWKAKQVTEPLTLAQAQEQFYSMWTTEIERLATEVRHLQVLVAALESEIITLGGDPMRVRLRALQATDPTGPEDR